MSIPDYQALMLPVLEIAANGETSVPQTEIEIARRFDLRKQHVKNYFQVGGSVSCITAFIGQNST